MKSLSVPIVVRVAIQALGLAALMSACAAPPMPSTSPVDLATIVAGTAAALQTASPIAPTASPLPSPTPAPSTPTSTPPPPVRVNFPPDGTTVVLKAHIAAGAAQTFAFEAIQGQPMFVAIEPGQGLALSIQTQGGTFLLRPSLEQSTWSGVIPRTEDYYVTVLSGPQAIDYALRIDLVSRIKLTEGPTGTLVNGGTTDGLPMVYCVFADEGKQLNLSIAAGSSAVFLAVRGLADGKTYLPASESKASLLLDVPLAQDYIIQVIPRDPKALHFALFVALK